MVLNIIPREDTIDYNPASWYKYTPWLYLTAHMYYIIYRPLVEFSNYINPLGLEGDISGDQEGGADPTVSMGSGRRKKRSTVKRALSKRQEVAQPEQELSENVT